MTDASMLQALAEAVIDGSDPDWAAAESSAPDDHARALVRHLRAVSLIGRERASVYSTGLESALGEAPLDLPAGSTWGSLRILEKVGRGRFGDVYRAWDPTLDREVALKILRRREAGAASDAVVHEGRLMARVRHPNVVTIYGAQRIADRTGLWMEFIHGRTLAAEIADRGPLGAEEVIGIGHELCAALEAVHAAGLVHRDVKAQNVMRERGGRIVLGDFGTGRELDEVSSGRAELAGTPVYLAPEIFDRQPATPRSDIYSLGTLLYHLATRDYPVKGRTIAALRAAHEARQILTLRSARPDQPVSLATAIDRAIAADPAKRFARAGDLAQALQPSLPRVASPGARARLAAAGVLVAAVVALALAGVVTRGTGTAGASAARTWVLVTAAVNRTGEAVLDGTIEYALERELSQSPAINVASRPRVADVLQLMQKPPDTPLDAATSREVALRDGEIRALVTGRVEKVGGFYRVSADVTDPDDGALLATVSEPPVPQAELLKAIGRAAIGVREQLGEGVRSTAKSRLELAKVTTPSLRALRLFSQVRSMLDGRGGALRGAGAAEQLLREAIIADPGFAAAHAALAEAIRQQSNDRLDEVLALIEKAISLSDGATEIERLRIEGSLAMKAQMTQNPVERTRWLEYGVARQEAILELQPNNYESLVILTNLYAQLRRPNVDLAVRLADMRPQAWEWTSRAVTAAMWEGNLETARRYARRGADLEVPVAPLGPRRWSPAWMRLFPSLEHWLRGDAAAALVAADRFSASVPALPTHVRAVAAPQLTYWYLTLGRVKAADEAARQIQDPIERRFARLRIAMSTGDPVRIDRVLQSEYPRIEDAAAVATALVMAHRIADARRALDIIRGRPNAGGTFAKFIEGQLALEDGNLDAAIEGIQAHSQMTGGPFEAGRLAVALSARGDDVQAIRVLESFSGPRARLVAQPGFLAIDWLSLRDQLATLYRKVGRHEDADVVEEELRALLAVADEDHPVKRRLEQYGRRMH